MKLMMSDFEVVMANEDSSADFFVRLNGPDGTAYANGEWSVHCSLPIDYPFKSPSIGFVNKMYHPNVDEVSGSVCLDVINQTWSPMFDLLNVFTVFIPQLLRYPNPTDPLNGEAAALLLRNPKAYAEKVRSYVTKFASGNIVLRPAASGRRSAPTSTDGSTTASSSQHQTGVGRSGTAARSAPMPLARAGGAGRPPLHMAGFGGTDTNGGGNGNIGDGGGDGGDLDVDDEIGDGDSVGSDLSELSDFSDDDQVFFNDESMGDI